MLPRAKTHFWRTLSLESFEGRRPVLQPIQGHTVIKEDATLGLKAVTPWGERECEPGKRTGVIRGDV